ncbi:LCP family protein [Actinokineospora sp. NBRC 105648]|uniref:LCP family protein n=1 Tax=Actinokineospora sp. NBRC 105648 TaxID=3032206 RepID=UPI0024A46774|nr:LCP family protein [Actinokineospora sp. NBRC 105648]GLZ40468.1 transcriptional regulator [Actinokineospora sp. NBRC 105648]
MTPQAGSERGTGIWRGANWVARALVAALAAAVVVTVGAGWSVRRSIEDQLTVLPAGLLDGLTNRPPAALAGLAATTPETVLLIGTDRPAGTDLQTVAGASDSVVLLHFNATRTRADTLAFPRDALVTTAGGQRPFADLLTTGGVPLIVSTVESLTGVRVDHIAVGDLAAIAELTTEVGGVEVINETAGTDPLTGTYYPAGPITLSGQRALTWARWIHDLPRGDLDRIEHQHQLLEALKVKITSGSVTRDPVKLKRLATAFARHLAVSQSLTLEAISSLFTDLGNVPKENLHFYTAPVTGANVLDEPLLKNAGTALNEDKAVPLPVTIG